MCTAPYAATVRPEGTPRTGETRGEQGGRRPDRRGGAAPGHACGIGLPHLGLVRAFRWIFPHVENAESRGGFLKELGPHDAGHTGRAEVAVLEHVLGISVYFGLAHLDTRHNKRPTPCAKAIRAKGVRVSPTLRQRAA